MTLLAQKLDQIQSEAKINAPADVGTLITNILLYIFSVAGILLLIYLIYGGLQLMISRGDPKGVAAAQAKITSALIGFVIVLISAILVRLIGQIFGITAFSQTFR